MTSTGYPRTFGPYVLLDRLGEGGMSEVDLARRAVDDADFVRFLVIKRIHPQHSEDDSFVRMFHDEARINAELQHENIASVYDFGQEGDEFFLAMEYVPGCDLRRMQRILARNGERWPMPILLRIVADMLSGLHYAHTRVDTFGRTMNIVHRDVNPRNIMLSMRGEVKIIDFGVAKAENRSEKTVGHSLKGKFAYMAPEQIEGGRGLDGRADIFAVGIVLYELLMGASPVAGLSEVQTMHRILAGQLPKVRSSPDNPFPERLVGVHHKATATQADDRYADAEAMRRDILVVADQVGGLASRADLAEFLRARDPDISMVSSRLHAMRTETTSDIPAPVLTPTPPGQTSSSGTLATRTVHAPTVAAAAGAGAIVGGLVLVLGIGGLFLYLRQGSEPDPAPTAAPTQQLTPAQQPPAPTEQPAPNPTAGSQAEPPPPATASPAATAEPASAAPVAAPAAQPAAQPASTGTSAEAQPVPAQAQPEQPAPVQAEPEQPAPAQAEPEQPAAAGAEPEQPAAAEAEPEQPAEAEAEPEQQASTGTAPVGATGFINVSSRPVGLELQVDGRSYGRTPVRALELPVGQHTLVAIDSATGGRWQQDVEISEGRTQLVVLGAQ